MRQAEPRAHQEQPDHLDALLVRREPPLLVRQKLCPAALGRGEVRSRKGRGKGPILRGLAARAPYFHNGAAADLHELVNFYNLRFQMNLTEETKQELIAFLNSL